MSVHSLPEHTPELKVRRMSVGALLIGWLLATMSLWFFAFYDPSSAAQDWVRRAQAACFGSDESGLPNAAGWMLLALSPAMFLGAILIALGDEARRWTRILFAHSYGRNGILLLGCLLATEVIWIALEIRERVQSSVQNQAATSVARLPDSYPRGSAMAADFSLVDQHGAVQKLSSFRGKPVILSFVFAHCRAACPTLVRNFKAVSRHEGLAEFQLLMITLDPWRDSPATLPGLAREWELGANELVLSGSPDEVTAVLDAFQVPRQRDQKSGDVFHPAIVHVISPDGTLVYSFTNPSVAWLRDALLNVSR